MPAEPPDYDGHRQGTFALVHPIAPHYNTVLRIDPTDRTELWDPATNFWQEVAPVGSGRAFARLVATRLGIYQLSGAAEGDTAQARVERFVWR